MASRHDIYVLIEIIINTLCLTFLKDTIFVDIVFILYTCLIIVHLIITQRIGIFVIMGVISSFHPENRKMYFFLMDSFYICSCSILCIFITLKKRVQNGQLVDTTFPTILMLIEELRGLI